MSTVYLSQSTEPHPRRRSKSSGIKFKQYIPPNERDPPGFFERLAKKMFGTSEERLKKWKERDTKRKEKERFLEQVDAYYDVLGYRKPSS